MTAGFDRLQHSSELRQRIARLAKGEILFSIILLSAILIANQAFAAATDPAVLLCQAAGTVGGGRIGQGAATLGFCIIGVSACFGRATWTQGIVVAIGAAVMATAFPIAASLVGTSC